MVPSCAVRELINIPEGGGGGQHREGGGWEGHMGSEC